MEQNLARIKLYDFIEEVFKGKGKNRGEMNEPR